MRQHEPAGQIPARSKNTDDYTRQPAPPTGTLPESAPDPHPNRVYSGDPRAPSTVREHPGSAWITLNLPCTRRGGPSYGGVTAYWTNGSPPPRRWPLHHRGVQVHRARLTTPAGVGPGWRRSGGPSHPSRTPGDDPPITGDKHVFAARFPAPVGMIPSAGRWSRRTATAPAQAGMIPYRRRSLRRRRRAPAGMVPWSWPSSAPRQRDRRRRRRHTAAAPVPPPERGLPGTGKGRLDARPLLPA